MSSFFALYESPSPPTAIRSPPPRPSPSPLGTPTPSSLLAPSTPGLRATETLTPPTHSPPPAADLNANSSFTHVEQLLRTLKPNSLQPEQDQEARVYDTFIAVPSGHSSGAARTLSLCSARRRSQSREWGSILSGKNRPGRLALDIGYTSHADAYSGWRFSLHRLRQRQRKEQQLIRLRIRYGHRHGHLRPFPSASAPGPPLAARPVHSSCSRRERDMCKAPVQWLC
ncbi:hypothetical protein C8R47DRAFT_1225058 [Mycena vitilis]|nr:hypothetical protein C8R47DRAFT_1225058 [Mycena vitilis]